MKKRRKVIGLIGAVMAAATLAAVVTYVWVLPAVIVGRIEALAGGKATIRSFWVGPRSAGLVGLRIHEGREAASPVWAEAETVSTDLTIGRLLRGNLQASRVTLVSPTLHIRVDRRGDLLTRVGPASSSDRNPDFVPVVVAQGARVVISQEGRPEMVVEGVTARVGPQGEFLSLAARSNDPNWGPLEAQGRIHRKTGAGTATMKTLRGLAVDREKVRAIPFVPADVWDSFLPTGDVDIRLTAALDPAAKPAVKVRTEVALKGTKVESDTLSLTASSTTGVLVVDGPRVELKRVSGSALGGKLGATGLMDFSGRTSNFNVDLTLTSLNVPDAPRSWQLDKVGVTGSLTGRVNLVARIGPEGLDFSGTTGEAVVEGGEIDGIPFKSLRLEMNGKGKGLQYSQPRTDGKSSNLGGLLGPFLAAVQTPFPRNEPNPADAPDHLRNEPNLANKRGNPGNEPNQGNETAKSRNEPNEGNETPKSRNEANEGNETAKSRNEPNEGNETAKSRNEPNALPDSKNPGNEPNEGRGIAAQRRQHRLVAQAAPVPARPVSRPDLQTGAGSPKAVESAKVGPAVKPPEALKTHIQLEDVDITRLIAKAQFLLGYPFPVPVSGRLSVDADATIPLGKLRSLKDYAFHGKLTLKKASAYRVDLGLVESRVDLADGVLELKEFRGWLVDRPNGGPDNPPLEVPAAAVPASGPLPPGAFRGELRASLSPAKGLLARFEGVELPLGELTAPVLPRPTPLSGKANLQIEASADLSAASDPSAWTVKGTASSHQIRYHSAALDAVAFHFRLAAGRLEVPDLTARMGLRPLAARAEVEIREPHDFQGTLEVNGWPVSEALAWVPSAPRSSPLDGALSAQATASGTLKPFKLESTGSGRVDSARVGTLVVGAVPFEWKTAAGALDLRITDAHPLVGHLNASVKVPLERGKPTEGSAAVESIDLAAVASALPGGSLRLTGRASGNATFSVPADTSALDAAIDLRAPDMTLQGLPAEHAKVSVRARKRTVGYEITADSLGGKVSVKGEVPLVEAAPNAIPEAGGELRVVGFGLEPLWAALGARGLVARVTGRGAIDANLRALFNGPEAGLYSHGVVEVRDLKYAREASLGSLRGIVASGPRVWRVDQIRGDLLGGVAGGFLSGEQVADPAGLPTRRYGFDLSVDRAPLSTLASLLGTSTPKLEGFALVRAAGTLGDGGRASGELNVARGTIAGLPFEGLKLPAELISAGNAAAGTVHIRRGSGRFAGGNVRGDATFRYGNERPFQAELNLAGVDLETLIRIESEARRPASGKINGKIVLSGPDPSQTQSYKGKLALDLDDASLVALPVFRELDRFLGAARGGLFEDGDLNASIANRQVIVDPLTLEGRIAQLHATGTVGFDGRLNLEVLVNTNQIIPETGAALANLIPGLTGARGQDSRARVAGFLSSRLLKLRVTGTLRSPSVNADPAIVVAETAVGFFAGVLKLPLGLLR